MVTKRLESLVELFERTRRAQAEKESASLQEEQAENELERIWNAAYSEKLFDDPDFIPETTDGLLRLRGPVRERLWEYQLVYYANNYRLTSAGQIAVQLILEAVFLDGAEVSASLQRILDTRKVEQGLMTDVVLAHRGVLQSIADLDGFVAYTPKLNQVQCAKMFGMSKDKFRSDWDAGRILDKSEAATYARYRRWQHLDTAIHMAGLRKILETYPEKVWSKNDG